MGVYDLKRNFFIVLIVELKDDDIEDLLNDSELGDFVPSDEDLDDPEYQPFPVSPYAVSDNDSSDSETSEDEWCQPYA